MAFAMKYNVIITATPAIIQSTVRTIMPSAPPPAPGVGSGDTGGVGNGDSGVRGGVGNGEIGVGVAGGEMVGVSVGGWQAINATSPIASIAIGNSFIH